VVSGCLGAAHDRVDETLRVEGCQIVRTFAETDELHGNAQGPLDRDNDAALRGSVKLGQHNAGDSGRLREHLRLLHTVLAGGGVQDQEDLGDGGLLFHDALDLAKLIHECGLVLQTARRVDEDDVDVARNALAHSLEGDGCRVGTFSVASHNVDAHALAPRGELVGGGGRISIPGFYDDVEELSADERAMLASIPFDEAAYKQSIGVRDLRGEKGYSTIERNACRPSFDICGMWSGYQGEGSKTVLPSKAFAKVSCRLVPHQQHEKVSQMFVDYVQSLAPDCVEIKVTPMHGGEGYVCPITLPAYRAAEEGFTEAFGKRPLAVRRGGSIPIISDFERVLGVKTVLMGFGLESNAIHSPNENFSLDIFRKGIAAVVGFHLHYKG